MKPGRQRRCRDENGGKKIEKYFLAHQTIQSREMEEKHKLFSLTIRNREKVRRQKLMMMAHIENSCWPSVYCIFFCRVLVFHDFPTHTHHSHIHIHIRIAREMARSRPSVESCFNVNDISLRDNGGEISCWQIAQHILCHSNPPSPSWATT